MGISQYILGIHPEFDGLRINPCVPKELEHYTITRKFRKNTYKIEFRRDPILRGIYQGDTFISVDFIEYDEGKPTQEFVCYY